MQTIGQRHARNIWTDYHKNDRTFAHPRPDTVDDINELDDYGDLVLSADKAGDVAVYRYGDTLIISRPLDDGERIHAAQLSPSALATADLPLSVNRSGDPLNDTLRRLGWRTEPGPIGRKVIYDAADHCVGVFSAYGLSRYLRRHGFITDK